MWGGERMQSVESRTMETIGMFVRQKDIAQLSICSPRELFDDMHRDVPVLLTPPPLERNLRHLGEAPHQEVHGATGVDAQQQADGASA